ncbi:MAG: glycosyltransferase family 4 protein [Planctomycetaceae bacterium]|nr:glycosyltransferase family 4 protein [Planctomycetaceae bacterium]
MLRIGILCEYPTLNGGEHSLLTVLDELGTSLRPIAICPESGPLADAFRWRDVKVYPLPVGPNRTALLQELLRQLPIDIVHANSLRMSRTLGQLAPSLPQKCTGHVRDIMGLKQAALHDLSQLDSLICVSAATAEGLTEQGYDSPNLAVITNGIDLYRFRPGPKTGLLHRELGIDESVRLVANIGQICLRKGQDRFVRAATEIGQQRPDVHFVHCGSRHSMKPETVEYDEKLDDAFAEAGMQGRWHRLGQRTNIVDILREVDVLLHTAQQEPFGRVLLEASACEIPIVATNVGGTADIVIPQETGLLVGRDDPADMAHAVLTYLNEEEFARRMASNARQRCIDHFSIANCARRTLDEWRRHIG